MMELVDWLLVSLFSLSRPGELRTANGLLLPTSFGLENIDPAMDGKKEFFNVTVKFVTLL